MVVAKLVIVAVLVNILAEVGLTLGVRGYALIAEGFG